MTDTTDPKLIKKYDEIYDNEQEFWTFLPVDERRSVLSSLQHWTGFDVLEIGCGSGDMAAQIAAAGAGRVIAIDASEKAIVKAKEKYSLDNLEFWCRDLREYREECPVDSFDVVALVGVLEHLNDPYEDLRFIMQHYVKAGGLALVTCPNFINPRGYVWKTLEFLFDAPMSLTDKNEIHPMDMQEFCRLSNYGLNTASLDVDWAMGPRALIDFKRRIPAALPDIKPEKITKLLDWLTKSLQLETPGNNSGANLLYQIGRPGEQPTIQ